MVVRFSSTEMMIRDKNPNRKSRNPKQSGMLGVDSQFGIQTFCKFLDSGRASCRQLARMTFEVCFKFCASNFGFPLELGGQNAQG
jgi:hypothetical protein